MITKKDSSVFLQFLGFISIFAGIWYLINRSLKNNYDSLSDTENLNSDWGRLYGDFDASAKKII